MLSAGKERGCCVGRATLPFYAKDQAAATAHRAERSVCFRHAYRTGGANMIRAWPHKHACTKGARAALLGLVCVCCVCGHACVCSFGMWVWVWVCVCVWVWACGHVGVCAWVGVGVGV